jgi:hypothetical protein
VINIKAETDKYKYYNEKLCRKRIKEGMRQIHMFSSRVKKNVKRYKI